MSQALITGASRGIGLASGGRLAVISSRRGSVCLRTARGLRRLRVLLALAHQETLSEMTRHAAE